LSTEATTEGFKTTLSYERQIWTLEGAVRDESRYPNVKYSSLVRLSSPTSLVDVQLMSNAAEDAELSSRGYGLKYLTSRDRELKTLALKTEINRLRKELKLEVNLSITWKYRVGQKTGPFLKVDNFAMVSGRKAYYMLKVCKFCLEKSVKLA